MDIATQIQQIISAINGTSAATRQALNSVAQVQAEHAKTRQVLDSLVKSGMADRADVARIENIPGRRIPYDAVVTIPIGSASTSEAPASHTVTQDGPFVAVVRYATFLSAYQFQVTTGQGATATFNGRSNGRYRPVSSVLDINDAMTGFTPAVGAAAPGDGLFSLVGSNQHAPFRTMQFDGTIEVESGSGYKRQSGPIPSSLWAPGWNFASQLPVLDFFERGDSIQFKAKPNHVNNPNAGNIQTLVGALPYLASQFDTHEGITYGVAVGGQTTADTITRQPDGILVIGYWGFKILAAATQP